MKWLGLVLGLLGFGLSACALQAQEPEPRGSLLVAVPSFQGELPDGTPVIGIIIVPAENVLNRSGAWQEFGLAWPARDKLEPKPDE